MGDAEGGACGSGAQVSDGAAIGEPITYAVRFSERAKRDADFITVYLADNATERIAIGWRTGLNKTVGSLSLFPDAKAVIAESTLFAPVVRNLLYRRTPDSQLLFRVLETSPDGPQVILMSVRLAARPPITPDEAREIEAQQ